MARDTPPGPAIPFLPAAGPSNPGSNSSANSAAAAAAAASCDMAQYKAYGHKACASLKLAHHACNMGILQSGLQASSRCYYTHVIRGNNIKILLHACNTGIRLVALLMAQYKAYEDTSHK